jgi:Ser/Thr protein kinase RdoA (MazF antagonist)
MSDQDQWQRMRDKFREERVKRNELREKILDEFNSAGLRISIHSKKVKQSIKYIHNDTHSNNYV